MHTLNYYTLGIHTTMTTWRINLTGYLLWNMNGINNKKKAKNMYLQTTANKIKFWVRLSKIHVPNTKTTPFRWIKRILSWKNVYNKFATYENTSFYFKKNATVVFRAKVDSKGIENIKEGLRLLLAGYASGFGPKRVQ